MKKQALNLLLAAGAVACASGSSHREAPAITETPKLDATDFYMFRSYEPGREGFVTLVANYLPLQDPYGGPNYFMLQPDAVYEIHIDNTGDAREDITFQFRFQRQSKDIALDVGPAGSQKKVAIPLINAGQISAGNSGALNVEESYTLKVVRGERRSGTAQDVTHAETGARTFLKPVDNIGKKSIPDYEAYAQGFLHPVMIPGCQVPARVFVGQRKDPFVVNLGETFDLVNLNPLGPPDGARDSLARKNVTSLILEVPISCLAVSGRPVISGWTTASIVSGQELRQVSRLGHPLVNEVVIGLKDKDRFNASEPRNDAQFLDYVTHPTLPELLELLFGVTAPNAFPREDLVAVFLTGVDGLTKDGSVGEVLRLNTDIAPKGRADQKRLGVLEGDLAGFPNGRRPGDDVVDIALRAVMGVLLPEEAAPSGRLPYTDGAFLDASFFSTAFPYLKSPLPGSPNDGTLEITLESSGDLRSYQPAAAGYNPATGEIVAPARGDAQFYRARSARRVELGDVRKDSGAVRMKVRSAE